MEKQNTQSEGWLDQPVFTAFPKFSREKLIITILILLAILSRFVMVGARVMSHDEVNHVVPAYNLYKGNGYVHDPVTHGPFQFHMLALSYFLLGDNDFSSRVPAALFSVAAIIFVIFAFRRYLGRIGTLVCGALFLVSPFILFYGRYTRNEAFIELFAVMTFYAILRYYDRRDQFSLYLLAVVTALQFVTKEVAYIYTAQILLFCGFLFLRDLWKMPWKSRNQQSNCAILFLSSLLLLLMGVLVSSFFAKTAALAEPESGNTTLPALILAGLGLLLLLYTLIKIIKALGWKEIRESASFNIIVFLGALILPQLSAFAIKLLGWDPLDYSSAGMLHSGIVLVLFLVISFLIGCWWNRKVFLKSAAAFYLIFILFYTTVFSNGQGFFTGIIGGLGYWLSQQDVQRGGQPWYYYGMVLLPVYEFAAIAGTVLAIGIAAARRKFWTVPGDVLSAPDPDEEEAAEMVEVTEETISDDNESEVVSEDLLLIDEAQEQPIQKVPVFLFFLYWTVSSLIAYSFAGEKMPWLSVHIAIPLAMCAAWGLGYLLERMPWKKLFSWNGLISIAVLFCGIFALWGCISALNSDVRPFSGKTLAELKTTSRFILSLLVLCVSIFILIRTWRGWSGNAVRKTLIVCLISVLLVLQTRTAFVSSFINYNYANELLVYAHAAPGPKIALEQIEEIASRTGEGKAIKVAYDNDALYPYWWYFRDYANKYYFGEGNPTRELRNYDIIIINSSKDGRMEPIVKDEYYRYQYVRLWWPNQDYFNLTPQRVFSALADPAMRSALFDIWLNRDYSSYADVTGKTTLTHETWEPQAGMVVYIKKDIMRKMWLLGDQSLMVEPAESAYEEDEKFQQLEPAVSFGSEGTGNGQFKAPRGLALSPDGERVYVLDSDNNRVEYFSKNGTYLGQWNGSASRGFNQPWGIACGPDGSVYIADTWNHRMMKYSADGQYLLEWYANDPIDQGKSFYGPRSIAVSSTGKVYVSDTGNKRIMVYDENGGYLNQFGTSGMGAGEFDEPVGIALLSDDRLAVADTWNQRVQIFDVSGDFPTSIQLSSFDVGAWYSQSLDNKPYITGNAAGDVFITDPEGYLVNEYNEKGELVRSWNGGGGDIDHVSMPTGITMGPDGSIWVIDTENCKVNKFVLN